MSVLLRTAAVMCLARMPLFSKSCRLTMRHWPAREVTSGFMHTIVVIFQSLRLPLNQSGDSTSSRLCRTFPCLRFRVTPPASVHNSCNLRSRPQSPPEARGSAGPRDQIAGVTRPGHPGVTTVTQRAVDPHHASPVTDHRSPITHHRLPVTGIHRSPVTGSHRGITPADCTRGVHGP